MKKEHTMICLAENLRKYRLRNNLTQEELAECLHITPQSVSKWERGETYPDITLLPALAYIFDTSIDLLVGMDTIRAEQTRIEIHRRATECMRAGNLEEAELLYRDALRIYPRKPGMILGLAGVLALRGQTEESISLIERGVPLSENEKQKATMRAVLCFLYRKDGRKDKAAALAYELPHVRECREEIVPVIEAESDESVLDRYIRLLLLGE